MIRENFVPCYRQIGVTSNPILSGRRYVTRQRLRMDNRLNRELALRAQEVSLTFLFYKAKEKKGKKI